MDHKNTIETVGFVETQESPILSSTPEDIKAITDADTPMNSPAGEPVELECLDYAVRDLMDRVATLSSQVAALSQFVGMRGNRR